MTLIGDRCFVFGGWSPSNYDNDLFMVDDHWRWAKVEASGQRPCARRGHSACAIGQKLYIFGGLYGCTRYLNDLYILDTYQMTWKKAEAKNPPPPRAFHTATVVEDYIIVIGGTSGRLSFYDDVWVYDVSRSEWSQIDVPDIPQICSHTATMLPSENCIIVACGLSPETHSEGESTRLNPTNSLYRLSWKLESGGGHVKSGDEEEEVEARDDIDIPLPVPQPRKKETTK